MFRILWKVVVSEKKWHGGSLTERDRDKATIHLKQGSRFTKRCRLSWLTNSALVYESKCKGKRGGSFGLSANEYSCAHGAQINFGDLTSYLWLKETQIIIFWLSADRSWQRGWEGGVLIRVYVLYMCESIGIVYSVYRTISIWTFNNLKWKNKRRSVLYSAQRRSQRPNSKTLTGE